jgi:hypothetical protein
MLLYPLKDRAISSTEIEPSGSISVDIALGSFRPYRPRAFSGSITA